MITLQFLALSPGREEARKWAEDELSKPKYRGSDMSLFERIGQAVQRFINSLIDSAVNVNNPWLIIVFALIIVAIIVFFVWRANRGSGDAFSPQLFERSEVSGVEDPEAYRKRAAEAARMQDWNTAVQETVRASVAHLAKTGAIELSAAATAHELTQRAATTYTHLGPSLGQASDLFDAVSFGKFEATEDDFEFVRGVDERVVTETRTKVGA